MEQQQHNDEVDGVVHPIVSLAMSDDAYTFVAETVVPETEAMTSKDDNSVRACGANDQM